MTTPKPWSGRHAQRLRALTLAHYGTICHLCGQAGADSADHLIPRSRGGDDSLENLRPAHGRCNSARGNRSIASQRKPLITDVSFFRGQSPDTSTPPRSVSPEPQAKPQELDPYETIFTTPEKER